jgi:flagellar biosynthesis protein FliP
MDARPFRIRGMLILALGLFGTLAPVVAAQEAVGDVPGDQNLTSSLRRGAPQTPAGPSPLGTFQQLPDLTKRENFSAAMQIIILLTVLSLAPAILIMMSSFTRLIIVLSLLRQALGTQQLPPNQVLIGLSLFMTFLIMGPTWKRVNSEALQPYMRGEKTQQDALAQAVMPVREFMIRQIRAAGNDSHVDLFTD